MVLQEHDRITKELEVHQAVGAEVVGYRSPQWAAVP